MHTCRLELQDSKFCNSEFFCLLFSRIASSSPCLSYPPKHISSCGIGRGSILYAEDILAENLIVHEFAMQLQNRLHKCRDSRLPLDLEAHTMTPNSADFIHFNLQYLYKHIVYIFLFFLNEELSRQ